MRVVLTGGGTGGHAYPAISIGEALKAADPTCELLFIGSRDGVEARLAEEAGIPFFGVTSRKLSRLFSFGTLLTIWSLGVGFREARAKLRRFKPDIVIGTGGYASGAVVLAQASRRGKSIILEPDVIPGRTNRLVGRFASRICLGFEDAEFYFPAKKVAFTGSPVRRELLTLPGRTEARAALGLDAEPFTVLVIGGSQGAKRLNQVVVEAVPLLSGMRVQILHQVGPKNYGEAEGSRKNAGWDAYHVRAYIEDMRNAYAAADVIMCRCGSSTIAEITAIGLPAILVPYPYAHADHQRLNAEYVAYNGGGVVVSDYDITARFFANTVKRLVSSPDELARMSEASKAIGKPNAAHDIARLAMDLARGTGSSDDRK